MKFELPARKRLVYEMTIPIRWGDIDAFNHLNNTAYFRFFETARIDWMHSIGCRLDPGGETLVIVNAFCTFHRQFDYPGDVRVKMFASDPGRTSFETWVTMERDDTPGEICASGGATMVWVDMPQQKSAPLPDWLRDRVS